ncbi:hypothetical protein TPCCA_0450a [Treponema paraluiscuniculi Cuniculi A]|uniref:Uncharacterized protein n=2 Tax=Treponema paraluiscuniculi TaxID=53435 RepID=F7XSR0_TREPU|nr:hypothetical protein TPCCA_0450a [Treponema paraluiscuniculi Cuniculi A]WKC72321.1 hypothetical protein TPLL2_0450a [Treponema paraluiscuniculi]
MRSFFDTSFLALAYVLAANPAIRSHTGMDGVRFSLQLQCRLPSLPALLR